jgi:hypothetical protein
MNIPQVKHASKAKTKNTAAILDSRLPIATQIASHTRTVHIPRAIVMNSRRRPIASIMYHYEWRSGQSLCMAWSCSGFAKRKSGETYRQERSENVPHLEKASDQEGSFLCHTQALLEEGGGVVCDDIYTCQEVLDS